jgi:hypothetical protein
MRLVRRANVARDEKCTSALAPTTVPKRQRRHGRRCLEFAHLSAHAGRHAVRYRAHCSGSSGDVLESGRPESGAVWVPEQHDVAASEEHATGMIR